VLGEDTSLLLAESFRTVLKRLNRLRSVLQSIFSSW